VFISVSQKRAGRNLERSGFRFSTLTEANVKENKNTKE